MKKLILKLLLIAVFVLFVFLGWRIDRSFNQSRWQGEQINLVMSTEKSTAVVSLTANDKQLNFLLLPEFLYFQLPKDLGDYPLGSVYSLGEIEGWGGGLLRKSLEGLLGIPIEGCIKASFGDLEVNPSLESLKNFFWQAIIRQKKTDFTFWDLGRFYLKVRQLHSSDCNFINLKETGLLQEKELADKTRVFEVSKDQIDVLIKKNFSEKLIKEEAIEIEILNSTEQAGLAGNLARMIDNMGGRVISLGNSQSRVSTSLIRYSTREIKESETLKRLMMATGFKSERAADLGGSRCQIQIILGEDYDRI